MVLLRAVQNTLQTILKYNNTEIKAQRSSAVTQNLCDIQYHFTILVSQFYAMLFCKNISLSVTVSVFMLLRYDKNAQCVLKTRQIASLVTWNHKQKNNKKELPFLFLTLITNISQHFSSVFPFPFPFMYCCCCCRMLHVRCDVSHLTADSSAE